MLKPILRAVVNGHKGGCMRSSYLTLGGLIIPFVFTVAASSAFACSAGCSCGSLTANCSCQVSSTVKSCTCTDGGCGTSTDASIDCSNVSCGGGGGVSSLRGPLLNCLKATRHEARLRLASFPEAEDAALDFVDVRIADDIPVQIHDLSYLHNLYGIEDARYRIRNNGPVPIVAIGLVWEYTDGTDTAQTPQYRDGWQTVDGVAIPVGADVPGMGPISLRSSRGLTHVSLTVSYVEFADGLKLGRDSDNFSTLLGDGRKEMLEEYRSTLQMLTTTGVDKVAQHLATAEPNLSLRRRAARQLLLNEIHSEGEVGLRAELQRLLNKRP